MTDLVQRHGNKELTEQLRREQQQRQEQQRKEAEWRATGCCEVCGQKLGFWDRLFGQKRCERHR